MNEDQIELEILRRYVDQHRAAARDRGADHDKCAEELDMRDVVRQTGAYPAEDLEYWARFWLDGLVGAAFLKRCSNQSPHKPPHDFHARAWRSSTVQPSAWDRMRELAAKLPAEPPVELEQNFGILRSKPQSERDFQSWITEAEGLADYSVGILFIDVDDFKGLEQEIQSLGRQRAHSGSSAEDSAWIGFTSGSGLPLRRRGRVSDTFLESRPDRNRRFGEEARIGCEPGRFCDPRAPSEGDTLDWRGILASGRRHSGRSDQKSRRPGGRGKEGRKEQD